MKKNSFFPIVLLMCLFFLAINFSCSNNEKSPTNNSVNLTSNLMAYYPFNGNANDESGNSNNGVINGTVTLTTDRFGNIGRAYSFPGKSSSYIDCGSSTSINVQNELTLSAWIYLENGFYNPRILSFEKSGFGGYDLFVTGTANTTRNLTGTFYGNNNSGVSNVVPIVPALAWQHILYTVSSTGIAKIFLNGQLVNSTTGVNVNNVTYGGTLNIERLS